MRPKGDSLQETLKLFQEGLTPDEIARKRNLSMSTINAHLYHFVKSGEIDVFRIIDNTTFDTIKTAIEKVGTWSLSAIKNNCPDSIGYYEIRLVVSHFISNNLKVESIPVPIKRTKVEITDTAKEFFGTIYIKNYQTLSAKVKEILSTNFSSYFDLMPWIRKQSLNFRQYTGGDRPLEYELSTFITTLRTELRKNGYNYNLEKKENTTTTGKTENIVISAAEALEKVNQQKPFNSENIEKRLREPEFPLYDSPFLKEQYHILICAFPKNVRNILIEHIPTIVDFHKKALHKGVEFSCRLKEKPSLDMFLEIFRQIYTQFYSQKLYAQDLYQSLVQQKPSNDLSFEETMKLDYEENRDKYFWSNYQYNPYATTFDFIFPHFSKPKFRHAQTGTLWFCEQKDEPIINYYDPFTDYADLVVVAVTLEESSRQIKNSLTALRFDLGYFKKVSIKSFSKQSISLYMADSHGIKEAQIYKSNREIYAKKARCDKKSLKKTELFFDGLIEKEREFRKWLQRLNKAISLISNDRLVAYSDYYDIRILDKTNSRSCSLYTFINWIEKNGIKKVKFGFHSSDSPSDNHSMDVSSTF